VSALRAGRGLAGLGLLAAWAWAAPAQADVRVDDFGARGDGVADDTAAIQAALDAAPPGEDVVFTPGKTYRIGNAQAGIAPRNGARLLLYGATLTMANEAGQRCRLITLAGRSRVTVSGGTLLGSRLGAPEWGIGIHVSDSSDVLIEDVVFRDFFTDAVTVTGNAGSQRVRIRRCRATNMGRNGMSLIAGADITVEDSLFEDTANTDTNMPRAGLSAEPNTGNHLRGLRVSRCHFRNNQGSGLLLQLGNGLTLTHLTVTDNVAEGNGLGGLVLSDVSHAVVAGNRVRGHTSRSGYGIALSRRAASVVVKGNVLEGNYRGLYAEGVQVASFHGNVVVGTGPLAARGAGDDGDGIHVRGYTRIVNGQPQDVSSNFVVVSGNSVRQSAGRGILVSQTRQAIVTSNTVIDSGQHGIQARFATTDSQIHGNLVVHSGLEQADAYEDVFLSHATARLVVAQNQHREGGWVRAGIGLDNAPDNLVSHNSLVGGPAVAVLQSPNAVRTAYNWRGSGGGWNRGLLEGLVQFLPPPPAALAAALSALVAESPAAADGEAAGEVAAPAVEEHPLSGWLVEFLQGERAFRGWTLEDLLRALAWLAERLLGG
jgi:hypothetical protein